jgi:hypothetical protein
VQTLTVAMTGTTVITTSRVIPMHQHQQSLPHRKRFRPESEFSHLRLLSAVRELPHTVGTSDTDSQQDEHDSGCVAEHPTKETCTAEADRLKELDAAIAATLRLKAAYQQALKESVVTLTQLRAQLKLASQINQQHPNPPTEPLGEHPRPELAPVMMQCTMPPLNALMQRHFVKPHQQQQQQQQQQLRTFARPLSHEQHEGMLRQMAATHTKAAVCNRASPVAAVSAAAAAAAPTPKAAPRYSGSEFVWGSGLQHLVTVTTDEYVHPPPSSYAVVSEPADSPQLHPHFSISNTQKSSKRSRYSVEGASVRAGA